MNEKTENKEEGIRIESENPIDKIKEFEAFVFWYSMPSIIRVMYNKEPGKLEEMGYNVEDEGFKQFLTIRTQKEFAKEFGVDEDTLTNWKKRADFKKAVKIQTRNEAVLRFKPDIDFMFTQKTMKEGDAPRVKLWYQIYCNWSERLIQAHEGKIETTPNQNISMITILNKKDPSGRKVGEILRDAIKRESE